MLSFRRLKLTEPNDSNLNPEIEKKMDDPLNKSKVVLSDSNNENHHSAEHYPLSELKNLILSIDWEITDEVLEKLLQQVEDLNMVYEHDKTILMLLQILNSLGVYIKKNGAKAHPKTFKTLNSVFSSLDKVVISTSMGTADKNKILNTEMDRYQNLRIQIAKSKAEKKKDKIKPQQSGPASAESFFPTPDNGGKEFENAKQVRQFSAEDMTKAVDEIKQYIHAEIDALKVEIKSLLKKG
jgi:hypothetical protein